MKNTFWLYGEKIGDAMAGLLARCSHNVNSRCTARTSNSTCGEALLPLAPTNTLPSEFRSKQAYCVVSETALSSFVSGVNSRMLRSLRGSAGTLRYRTLL